MKNTLFLFVIIVATYFFIGNIYAEVDLNEAIRLRVIPNSNDVKDQEIKKKVSHLLQNEMNELMKDTKGISNARKNITNNLGSIDNKINNLLLSENYDKGYKINFGLNYFPEKKYKDVTFKEGKYESVLVTLGKGEGDNWWCILFPPLCAVEVQEGEKVEYKSFVKEIINKHL